MYDIWLNKVIGFWNGLTFTNNVKKMRKVLMEYLKEEGVESKISDGDLIVTYNDVNYIVVLKPEDGYAECHIISIMTDEDYEKLEPYERPQIANRVNIEMENHCKLTCYKSKLVIYTYFYATNKEKLLNLFAIHLDEMDDTLDWTVELVNEKVKEHQQHVCKQIGFNVYAEQEENDTEQISAKA